MPWSHHRDAHDHDQHNNPHQQQQQQYTHQNNASVHQGSSASSSSGRGMILHRIILVMVLLMTGFPFDTGIWFFDPVSGQVMTGESICASQYISTSISSFDKIRDCRVIEGNLKIVLFDHTMPSDFVNLTFPNLIEITEYLIIFRVSGLQSLGRLFPNLAVIRGQELFQDYALVVYQMNSLAELDLQNLRSITRGAVRIQKNPNLCFADTINWNLIATSPASVKRVHEISDNKKRNDCPKCRSVCPIGSTSMISTSSSSSSSSSSSKSSSSSSSSSLSSPTAGDAHKQQHLCWSIDKCQKVCNGSSGPHASSCGTHSCFLNDSSSCCHPLCLAGCTGPHPWDCIACSSVVHSRTCMQQCPAQVQGVTLLEINERRCVSPQDCIRIESDEGSKEPFKLILPEEDPRTGKKRRGQCLKKCPKDYETDNSDKSKCVRCRGGRCPVFCSGGPIRSVQQAQQFFGCTKVTSGIDINILRSSSGAGSIVTELEKNLADIEEIDGHLKVHRSYPLVSLYFFKNLRLITGKSHARQNYSFLVNDNVNMKDLFDWKSRNGTKLEIRNGKIFIANNPRLCMKKIDMLKTFSNIRDWSDMDVNPHTNGDREACDIIDMSIQIKMMSPVLVMISWKNVRSKLHDPRSLIAYNIFWRTAKNNVSKYEGKDACSLMNDVWNSHEVVEGIELSDMSSILPALRPATRYALYIQSYMASTANKGGESDVVYFETLPDKPTDPLDVTGRGINESTIEISWKKPKRPNGRVTHYILNVQPVPQMKEPERDYCEYDATASGSGNKDDKSMSMSSATGSGAAGQTAVKTCVDPHSSSPSTSKSSICFGRTFTPVEEGCCRACTQHDADDEAQNEISFENYLHNLIYVRKKTTPSDAASSSIPAPSAAASTSARSGKQRQSRSLPEDVAAASSKYSAAANTIMTADSTTTTTVAPGSTSTTTSSPSSSTSTTTTSNTTSASDNPDDSDESSSSMMSKLLEPFNLTVNSTGSPHESVNISGLNHFSFYDVKVYACHDANAAGKKLCSLSDTSQTTVQTSSKRSADEIPWINIMTDSSNSSSIEFVHVKWERPVSPNGDIVSYTIRLSRVGRDQPENKCLNESEFLKHGGGWKSADLLPGEYTIRVRANSLAAHGDWSEEQKFIVTDLNAMSWSKIFLISILILILFMSSTGLISFYIFKKARANLPHSLEYVSMNPEYMPAYEADEWEVDRDNIILLRDLGEGSFGKVFQGILKNTINGVTEMQCAVKTVRDGATARARVEFLQEASLMKSFNCHHVVKLLGVVSKSTPVYVCMELMALGDLKNYLRSCRRDQHGGPDHPLPTKQLVHLMSCQIADGMSYLAAKKYVHRDLAGRNCMVAADLTVKIGDFGMTRDVYETDYYRRGGKGKVPVRWMAPESLRDGVFSSQSDVWSFGVVLWEIVTLGEQPYQGYANEKVVAIVKGGGNPGRPENCPEDLFSVMQLCWSWHQKARPTFGEVIDSLLPEIVDTDMGEKFRKTSYYINVEKNNVVVTFADEVNGGTGDTGGDDGDGDSGHHHPDESSPLSPVHSDKPDANKNISNSNSNNSSNKKLKFMPSAVEMDGWDVKDINVGHGDGHGVVFDTEKQLNGLVKMNQMTGIIVNGGSRGRTQSDDEDDIGNVSSLTSPAGSPSDHRLLLMNDASIISVNNHNMIKGSGTNTMSMKSTLTGSTIISNTESDSTVPTTSSRHNSNTTTTSTNTDTGIDSGADGPGGHDHAEGTAAATASSSAAGAGDGTSGTTTTATRQQQQRQQLNSCC